MLQCVLAGLHTWLPLLCHCCCAQLLLEIVGAPEYAW
jgi:hypothetical protein